MKIEDGFEIHDSVSGLHIKVIRGKALDILRVERIGESVVNNRDFFFDRDGKFDGTGSAVG